MAKKLLSSKANYVSKRMINELEVENKGKTTYIDGADLIDGMYVKKGVKYAKGSTVPSHDRMYNFLKDDLAELESSYSALDFASMDKFFSYWNTHLPSLKTKTNDRMYNFLKDDLKKLEKAMGDISDNSNDEEIDRFFSYWGTHLETLKMAKGGGLSNSKYIPNRMVQSVEVERKGKTTDIDGAEILDGFRVKKGVKFATGGGVDGYLFMYECNVSLIEKTTYAKKRVSRIFQVWAKSTEGARKICEKIIKKEYKENQAVIKGIKQTKLKSLEKGVDLENIFWQKKYNPFGKDYSFDLLVDGYSVHTSIAKSWIMGDKWAVHYRVLGRKVEETSDSSEEAKKYVVSVLKEQLQDKTIKNKLIKDIADFKKDRMYKMEQGGALEGWGGTSESSQDGMLIGGTNAELTSNQYGKGGGVGEKKYVFSDYFVSVVEDSYEHGEKTERAFNDYHEKVGKTYNSIESLIKDMNKIMGTEYSRGDFDWETGEGQNVQTDVMVDEDLIPPHANEVERWKKGEVKLYNAHYWFNVLPVHVADEYAKGGAMTSGWCYSIGGL